MRFIEYMPMGAVCRDPRNRTVSMREMLERLRERFDLVPEDGALKTMRKKSSSASPRQRTFPACAGLFLLAARLFRVSRDVC